MTINVGPEQEHLIAQAIESGAYETPEDVVNRALYVFSQEDLWLEDSRPAINEKIERAFGRFERGEFFDPQQTRTKMRARKDAWLRSGKTCSRSGAASPKTV